MKTKNQTKPLFISLTETMENLSLYLAPLQGKSPVLDHQKTTLLSTAAAIDELDLPDHEVVALKENVFDAIAHLLGGDVHLYDFTMSKLADQINTSPLRK